MLTSKLFFYFIYVFIYFANFESKLCNTLWIFFLIEDDTSSFVCDY